MYMRSLWSGLSIEHCRDAAIVNPHISAVDPRHAAGAYWTLVRLWITGQGGFTSERVQVEPGCASEVGRAILVSDTGLGASPCASLDEALERSTTGFAGLGRGVLCA